jgi:hypothetical protein
MTHRERKYFKRNRMLRLIKKAKHIVAEYHPDYVHRFGATEYSKFLHKYANEKQ